MSTAKTYDKEYKVQAVKLALEIGQSKAAAELGISSNTVCGWVRAARTGKLDIGDNNAVIEKPLSISEKNSILEKKIKAMEKEIRELKEMNEFLEEASAFFAASRQK